MMTSTAASTITLLGRPPVTPAEIGHHRVRIRDRLGGGVRQQQRQAGQHAECAERHNEGWNLQPSMEKTLESPEAGGQKHRGRRGPDTEDGIEDYDQHPGQRGHAGDRKIDAARQDRQCPPHDEDDQRRRVHQEVRKRAWRHDAWRLEGAAATRRISTKVGASVRTTPRQSAAVDSRDGRPDPALMTSSLMVPR